MRIVVNRRKQSALQHVLQHSDRLQTHRLAARVGSRYHQQTRSGSQHNVERHNLAPLTPQRQQQFGMTRMIPFQFRPVGERRHTGVGLYRVARLGSHEIEPCHHLDRLLDQGYRRPQPVGQTDEYACDLAALLHLQLPYAVVGLHHLGRLYEHRLARGTLIVDYA